MSETVFVLLSVVAYLIFIYVYVAFLDWRDRKKADHNTTSAEYSTAAGSLGFFAVYGLIVGNIVTGEYTVGFAESIHLFGVGTLWNHIAFSVGYIIFGLVFVPIYRSMRYKHGSSSLVDAMSHIFDARVARLISIVTAIAFMATYATGPLVMAALLNPMTGLSYNTCFWGSTIFFVLFTLSGGLKGIARAGVVHTAVIIIGVFILMIACLREVGNFSTVIANIPEGFANPFSAGAGTIIGILAVQTCASFCSALPGSGALGARRTKDAVNAQTWLAITVLVFLVMISIVGLTTKYLLPDISPASSFYLIISRYGIYMAAIGTVATLAAVASSAPTVLLVASSNFVEEFYTKSRENPSDRTALLITKALVIIFGLAMPIFAQKVEMAVEKCYGRRGG